MISKLPQNQFDNVIRWIKTADSDRLAQLQLAVKAAMQRLRIRSAPELACSGVPAGSDHFESGSIVEWLSKVTRQDMEASHQVCVLDATIQHRISG